MKFGIIGTTPRATAIARLLAGSAHEVNISDPTEPMRAQQLARELGVTASVPYKQAISSEILVMAMPWRELEPTLRQLGPLSDELIIDAMLPDGSVAGSGAESLARKLDNRHIVEAFLEERLEPGATLALCSDDPEARKRVADIMRECGCTPRDLGPLSSAERMERHVAA